MPLYKTSFAHFSYPNSSNILPINGSFMFEKLDNFAILPLSTHTLPIITSKICPKVIRLGNACGFIIISGTIPFLVKGISSAGNTIPIVPFCPKREQNLSPISGILSFRKRNLI